MVASVPVAVVTAFMFASVVVAVNTAFIVAGVVVKALLLLLLLSL